jgi:hypothetical protein
MNNLNNMTNVESSCVAAMAANKENRTIDLRFHTGTTYRYFDVPDHLYGEFLKAESHGRFLNTHIRNKYQYELLTKGEAQ